MDLANLPSDVVRHIIRVGQESVDEMKLISHQWNALAYEHLSNRKHLPTIKCIDINASSCYTLFTIIIRISERYKGYFRAEHWHLSIESPSLSDLDRTIDIKSMYMKANEAFKLIQRIIKRSNIIAQIKINTGGFFSQRQLQLIKSTMENSTVKEVIFDLLCLDDYHASRILDMIRDSKLACLTLSNGSVYVLQFDELRKLSTEALRHVPVINISFVDKYRSHDGILEYWKDMSNALIASRHLKTHIDIKLYDEIGAQITFIVEAKYEQ